MNLQTLQRERIRVHSRALFPTVLFVAFFIFFLCFPSRNYMAVDGALRAMGVYHNPSLQFHGNNHLLYPVWVLLWSKLAHAFGIQASNGFEFMRISQAMNGFFAAGAIAILCSIVELFAESEVALLLSVGFGVSTAFLLHATNSAEPMPGLFFCLVGMRVLMEGLRRNSRFILAASGISFALALASYQAMGTIAGMGVFACFWWSWARRKDNVLLRAISSLFWVASGALFAVCGIYGFAYARQGIPASQMPRQFLSLGGGPEVYSGFTISRFLNAPVGLLRNLFFDAPPGYGGIRALLHDPQRAFWIPLMLAGLALAGLIAWFACKALRNAAREWPRSLVLAGLGAIAFLCFPPLYWDPAYDKLWLLPLAALAAVVAFSFRPSLLGPIDRKVLTALLIVVLAAESAVNLPVVLGSHFRATPDLAEAADLNQVIMPGDWVMLDFDNVSALWASFWGQNANFLILPASDAAAASEWLASARRACQQSGGRILFVGILDQDPNGWDEFLGKRVGIPYQLLNEYRARSTVLKTYHDPERTVTVREFH